MRQRETDPGERTRDREERERDSEGVIGRHQIRID
jgi:hypothetical protein